MPSKNKTYRLALRKENKNWPVKLVEIPKDRWPRNTQHMGRLPIKLFRSRNYLVQLFEEPTGFRISVNKSEVMHDGNWSDGLTWDELNDIKTQLGFAHKFAIEIYPREIDVVNVANMRHLWILNEPLDIGWKPYGNQ